MQASKGVVVASFELKMDVLMAMHINSSDIDRLFDSINNASTSSEYDVISAVVFRFGAKACFCSLRPAFFMLIYLGRYMGCLE